MKSQKYVDGFVLPVARKNLAAYRKMAQWGAKLWRKHGALQYFECVGDDLNPSMGGMKAMTFPQAIKPKKGETIVFSFITYRSRKHRDQVNKKVMSDPIMNDPKYKDMPMPFDMARMIYGGFKTMVEL